MTDNQQFMRTLREQSAARQQQAVSPLPAPGGRVPAQDEQWMRDVQQRLASRVALMPNRSPARCILSPSPFPKTG